MRHATSAVTRGAAGLALLLGVAACRPQSRVNAVAAATPGSSAAPDAAAIPASSATAAPPAPTSSAPAARAAVPRPVDPHAPHPVLLALVRRLSEWSPALASRLASVSLADTAAADPQRTKDYLLYLVAQRLLEPTVSLSADPILGNVAESIEESTPFGLNSMLTRLSMKEDLTPGACYDCQDCSADSRCALERKRLAPVFFLEDGLGFYDGLCDHENDFPWFPTCELALERYLDATVTAGLSRKRIEDVCFQIVQDVARRCRTIEQPLALDPDHSLDAAQVLEQAHARWQARYGTSLRGEPLTVTGAVRSTTGSDEAGSIMGISSGASLGTAHHGSAPCAPLESASIRISAFRP